MGLFDTEFFLGLLFIVALGFAYYKIHISNAGDLVKRLVLMLLVFAVLIFAVRVLTGIRMAGLRAIQYPDKLPQIIYFLFG